MDEREQREIVKDLADAFSTQAKVANRIWLGLIVVALFAVLPLVPDCGGSQLLPFLGFQVATVWFQATIFGVLVVLGIAFAAAHAQQVRSMRLGHSVIDKLQATGLIPPRDLLDVNVDPSLNRVAPLAQGLQGIYQTFVKKEGNYSRSHVSSSQKKGYPVWLKLVTVIFYAVYKATSYLIYFGMPIWGLRHSYHLVSPAVVAALGCWRPLLPIGFWLASIALYLAAVSDALTAPKVFKRLWNQS